MELIGRLTKKFDTAVVSEKFKKREFILTTEENTQYPQPISIQFTQDKCALLDAYNEDDEVKIHFNIKGRYWNGPQGDKWFNTIEAWRIELIAKGSGQPNVATQQSASGGKTQAELDVEAALAKMTPEARAALLKVTNQAPDTPAADDNDDLPF